MNPQHTKGHNVNGDHNTKPAPRLPILAMFGFLGLLGGALTWVLSGHWEWIAVGVGIFLATGVIGAAIDSGEKR